MVLRTAVTNLAMKAAVAAAPKVCYYHYNNLNDTVEIAVFVGGLQCGDPRMHWIGGVVVCL